MNIEEKGKAFVEEIEIDVSQQIEIFRVPSHNDVEAAHYYHDFKKRMTATKIPSQKVCHISEMDSSLPSPRKLKADMKRAASRIDQLPVTTRQSLVMVTGSANRTLLPDQILKFCGALPIYNTEVVSNPIYENGNAIIRTRRYKRESIRNNSISNFKSCLKAEDKDMFTYVREGNCFGLNSDAWDIRCKMVTRGCYYLMTCKKMPEVLYWNCTTDHLTTGNPFCCDPICRGQIIT
ncbi:unnamed protein product [Porites lobata]|uniref:BRICHOS domain-containing protein n=1 Tax=Porites lobata TaxID=104759 RepID=A0ABN8NNM8_9CNID|nr:unnamed protein product [Porites lobata]